MAKLNLLLLAVLVACALGLVTSQHKGRRAFSQLERAGDENREEEEVQFRHRAPGSIRLLEEDCGE